VINDTPPARARDDLVATASSTLKIDPEAPGFKSYFHAKHLRYAT
jgi:hypothetical protein